MTVLDDMLRVHAFRQLLDARDDHEPGDISGVLRGGWDVWERPEDLDLTGVARLPHLAILSGLDLRHTAHRPVLAMDMGRTALNAGFWRQLNILPNSDQRRRDERHDASDPFAPIDGQLYPERAAFLRAIFGHTPADIVEFLVCLREKDKQTARLLLAKDFKAALAGRSALIEMPWPDAVRARWSREGGGLVFVRDMPVYHQHVMGFRSFMRMHFHYGRGARRFRKGEAMGSVHRGFEPGKFYWGLIVYPFGQAGPFRGALLCLAQILSQGAHTAGYLREALGE